MFKQFDAILGKATVAAVMAAAMIGFNSCSEDNTGVDDGGTGGGGNPGAPVGPCRLKIPKPIWKAWQKM